MLNWCRPADVGKGPEGIIGWSYYTAGAVCGTTLGLVKSGRAVLSSVMPSWLTCCECLVTLSKHCQVFSSSGCARRRRLLG